MDFNFLIFLSDFLTLISFFSRYGGTIILLCLCHLLFEWADDVNVLFALFLSQVRSTV